MIEYVGWFVASGSTDFKNAYAQVEKMLSLGTDGGCSNVILFMTDGEADFEEVDYENLSLLINRRNALLFTYALGSGANVVAPRRMACENNGVFFRIEDGGDLGGAMSSYYTYIAAATSQQVYRKACWFYSRFSIPRFSAFFVVDTVSVFIPLTILHFFLSAGPPTRELATTELSFIMRLTISILIHVLVIMPGDSLGLVQ